MLICAVSVVPVIFAARMESMWGGVLLIGLATAAHQGFSANLYTIASDMFPTRATASVIGIGGAAGAFGGFLISTIVGPILQRTGSYQVPFLIAGAAYLCALGMIHLLAPKLAPAALSETLVASND
jgi:ACS family hexuronate transporter-like MFS transporter